MPPPRPVDRPGHALAPLLLPLALLLTPEQFEAVCKANPDAVLELDASGHVIHTTPTGSETGARNGTLLILLGLAVRASGLPLKLFDSSSGFRLPDGSVLSPDASLLRQERWEALTPEERQGFAPLCPDPVVEVWPASGGGEPQRIDAATSLDAGPLFSDLQIDLLEIWQG